jgi:plasmid replication initiation protein
MARKEIAIANKIISSRYRLTDLECRIVFHLIGRIKKEDKNFVDYKYTVKELLKAVEMSPNNVAHLFGTIESIFVKPIHINTGNGWIKYHWFDIAEYVEDEDIVRFRFNVELKPYLLELCREFTLLDFQCIMKLSVHSRRIYMLAKKDEWQHKSKKVSIAELRELLELGKGYASYKNLRVRILEPAEKEINELSDITLTITPDETTRIGRAYQDLIFTAKLKPVLKQITAKPTAQIEYKPAPAPEPKNLEWENRFEERTKIGKEMDKIIAKRWAALSDTERGEYMSLADATARGLENMGVTNDTVVKDVKLLALGELGKDLDKTDREYRELSARYDLMK